VAKGIISITTTTTNGDVESIVGVPVLCSIKCSTCTVIIVVQVASHFVSSNIWFEWDTNNAKSKQTEE